MAPPTLTPAQSRILHDWKLSAPVAKRHFIAIGRRGGASTLATRSVVQDALAFLNDPKDQDTNATFTLVAINKDQSRLARTVINALLWPYNPKPYHDGYIITTGPKKTAYIRTIPATVNHMRGYANRTVVLDGFAYYPNPHEIYLALSPTIQLPKGRMLILTPPHHSDPDNYFNYLFHGHKNTTHTICRSVPTWEARTDDPNFSQNALYQVYGDSNIMSAHVTIPK